jgi:hypothetical protein
MGLPMDNDPKHNSKVLAKWLKDNKAYKNFVGRTEEACVRSRRPTNLTPLHQLCQEEWAKIHSTYSLNLFDPS